MSFEIKPGYVRHEVKDGEILIVDLYDKNGEVLGSHVKIPNYTSRNVNIIDPSHTYVVVD